jgi:dolichol-phosphate mannosyltransferase
MNSQSIVLSVVIPVYNEVEVLKELRARLNRVLQGMDVAYEVVFVDDGSADGSSKELKRFFEEDPHLVVVRLSRNFGHQYALTAGLHASGGKCVVMMDADLQDPPEVIPDFFKMWREGYDVVIAQRRSPKEGRLRRLLFFLFYKVLGIVSDYSITLNAGVFGLMDQKVVQGLVGISERNRFLPGLRSWLGFKQAFVLYDRENRTAGKPKQTFLRLLRYGFDAIFSFSYKPLRVSSCLGIIISGLCLLYAVFLALLRIFNINVVPGFTTPTVAILFLGGVQLIAIGILGEYLGRIYDEVKRRPLYVIEEELSHSTRKDETTTIRTGKSLGADEL